MRRSCKTGVVLSSLSVYHYHNHHSRCWRYYYYYYYYFYYHFNTIDGIILLCTCSKYSSCTIYSLAADKSGFFINYLQKVTVSPITWPIWRSTLMMDTTQELTTKKYRRKKVGHLLSFFLLKIDLSSFLFWQLNAARREEKSNHQF